MSGQLSFPKAFSVILITILLALSALNVQPVQAAGTVMHCSEAALNAAIGSGGTVTFGLDCSAVPVVLTSTITITADTTIDANGKRVQISGGNAVRLFIVNPGATLTLKGLYITGGSSNKLEGGAVLNSGTLIINGTTFANNTSLGGNGGAIYTNGGVVEITNSTFSGNVTHGTGNSGLGGALYNYNGNVTITNSTISGNGAQENGGGGIYATKKNGAPVTRIRNTILLNNQGNNCGLSATTITNEGGNISHNTSSSVPDTSCGAGFLNANPGFSSLGEYGSLMPLFALQAETSPAIDLGTANCPATDQRGVPRSTPACDSGAYEYRLASTTTVTASVNPATYGDPVTLQASVSPAAVTGMVRFYAGTMQIGSGLLTSGAASYTTRYLPAGTYPIRAEYAGDSTYEISTDWMDTAGVITDLTVEKAPLIITAHNKDRLYGEENPDFTFFVTGFKNGETASVFSVWPVCHTIAEASSPIGQYDIICSGGVAENYSFNYVNATLNVTGHQLTVKANNQSRAYGSANPELTYTITGFKAGDDVSDVDSLPSCSTTAEASSPVIATAYPITCSGAADDTYSFTYQSGGLSITPKTATVTATNQSRAYGADNPPFTYAVTGFVPGDTEAVLTQNPVCTSSANSTSPVGTPKQITCVGAMAQNYSFLYTPGQLTITPVELTVVANAKSRTYGASNPTLDATISGFVNQEGPGALSQQPICTTIATPLSPASAVPYIINCSDAAATNYTFAYQYGLLTVNPATLTVNIHNQSKAYGAALPDLTYAISGYMNEETEAVLTSAPECSSTASATSPVSGSPYPITCANAAADNYIFNYQAGQLTVTPVALSVTASNAERAYGATNPTFTSVITGFIDGESPAVLSHQPVCVTAAGATSTVAGSPYPITCSGATAGNYTFAYTPGQLTVTRASLTAAANNRTRAYGAANPALTVSYSGFANGETAAVFTSPLVCETTADPFSTVAGSPYPITCAGAEAANYAITLVPAELTVTPALLTVKADNLLKGYNEDNPPLTYTITGFVNGESGAVVSGIPELATNATKTSEGGSYPILITTGSLSAANYTFQFQDGVLTVIQYKIFLPVLFR